MLTRPSVPPPPCQGGTTDATCPHHPARGHIPPVLGTTLGALCVPHPHSGCPHLPQCHHHHAKGTTEMPPAPQCHHPARGDTSGATCPLLPPPSQDDILGNNFKDVTSPCVTTTSMAGGMPCVPQCHPRCHPRCHPQCHPQCHPWHSRRRGWCGAWPRGAASWGSPVGRGSRCAAPGGSRWGWTAVRTSNRWCGHHCWSGGTRGQPGQCPGAGAGGQGLPGRGGRPPRGWRRRSGSGSWAGTCRTPSAAAASSAPRPSGPLRGHGVRRG